MQPGFNKYYPPDYDGKRTLNQLAGKRPQTVKGKLAVRFELPFSIYCESCQQRISQGKRYNAEKTKMGNYYSTPIYSFTFKCHLCGGVIKIQTDPQNTDYKIISGSRRIAADGRDETSGATAVRHLFTREGKHADPLAALEKSLAETAKENERNKRLADLYDSNQRQWEDAYTQSQKLRKIHRDERNAMKSRQREVRGIQDKYSLSLDIVEGRSEDEITAGTVKFKGLGRASRVQIVKAVQNAVERDLDPWDKKNDLKDRNGDKPKVDSIEKGNESKEKLKDHKYGTSKVEYTLVDYDSE